MENEGIAHRCFRCGYCKYPSDYQDFNCPSYRKMGFDTYSSGGRMWLINALLNGDLEMSDHLAEILYSCVTCANCEEHCPFPKFNDELLDLFESAKQELLKKGQVPPSVRDYLESVRVHKNPYERSQKDRRKWAEGMDINTFSDQDFLFYVGDVGSFDEKGSDMAKSVGKLLGSLGVNFGILGKDEISDGNDVKACGEKGLFEKLAESNINKFREMGVEKIITLDPHAYNTFTQDYPWLGGEFEVWHFTQILEKFMKDEKISLSEYDKKVTYHDPCYLGRHNGVYDTPREVLRSIPGLDLVEMRRNRENSFCCGGGGGNVFTDVLESSGENSPSRVRVREALDTGADVLAVSCPACLTMLTDAVKAEGVEGEITVRDLAEIIADAKSGKSSD